jgi:L-asparaginase II
VPVIVPAHLATIHRGGVVEAVVRGHVAVVDSQAGLLSQAGDAGAITTLRSCVKPLQALPFVDRAADVLGASVEEVAVACSSHNGEPRHVRVVTQLLSRCGLDESALSCGPQLPFDDEAAQHMLAAGQAPRRITNNCSGKHAAMLATCVAVGWPLAGYASWGHPLQVAIRGVMGDLAGIDLDRSPHGIDGCGLPTHGLPLSVLGELFAAASGVPGFRRCQDAMATHPHLVAGRRRFDTDLLAVAGEQLTCKGGGAAVWVAVRRPAGPALAIKLEAGDMTAMPPVALAALRALGWLDDAQVSLTGLARHLRPDVRNWDGQVVGSVDVETGWADSLAG